MKNCPCWHSWWDHSFLPAASSCLWALHTHRRENRQSNTQHTHLNLTEKTQAWTLGDRPTQKICVCLRVNKKMYTDTPTSTHKPATVTSSGPLLSSLCMWRPQPMNPRWKTTCIYSQGQMTHKHTLVHAHFLWLWPSPPATLQWKSHDGPHPALKNSQESPPRKKHQQTKLQKQRGFRGKAHRGFDPSRPLKRAEAIGWFQLFDIISDGPLVQNKALIVRDV